MLRRGAGRAIPLVVTPAVKREAVAHLKTRFGLSERRACRISGADTKWSAGLPQRAPDTVLRGGLRQLANESRRFGYRRLFVLLRGEGEGADAVSNDAVYAALPKTWCDQDDRDFGLNRLP